MSILYQLLSPEKQAIVRVLWLNYKTLPTFIIFTLIRLIWMLLYIPLRWLIAGCRSRTSREYESCAHVENILWSTRPTAVDEVRVNYFMNVHSGFEHPRCVLNENFMIMKVTRKYAYFGDFGKPIPTHFNVRNCTFLWDQHVWKAKRMITIPIQHLHRLVQEEIAVNQRVENLPVSILFSTGRCGSTLMANIVDMADPKCLVLSEPGIFTDLWMMMERVPREEFDAIILSSMRILCKPFQGKSRYFLKPLCLTIPVGNHLKRVLPNLNMMFGYRDTMKTAWAHERAFGTSVFYHLYIWAMRFNLETMFANLIGTHRIEDADAVRQKVFPWPNMLQMTFHLWGCHFVTYQHHKKLFKYTPICYDHVFQDSEKFVSGILEAAGYDLSENPELLKEGMKALKRDSQEGSALAQNVLRNYPVTKITPDFAWRASEYCRLLGVPPLPIDSIPKTHNPEQIHRFFDKNYYNKPSLAEPSKNSHRVSVRSLVEWPRYHYNRGLVNTS